MNDEIKKIKCDKCDGYGSVFVEEYLNINGIKKYNPKFKICPKCQGNKEVDWIENIVGVKKKDEFKFINCVFINPIIIKSNVILTNITS